MSFPHYEELESFLASNGYEDHERIMSLMSATIEEFKGHLKVLKEDIGEVKKEMEN